MIISASRRTDIPFYYSKWFFNRIEEGFCLVPNPFNPKQISLVDLTPDKVTAIVFWTRDPAPLIKNINILDNSGYKYYFQFTINNYPKLYEPHNPNIIKTIKVFKNLSEKIGKGKVVWRYDPIFFTDDITLDFHLKNFSKLCSELGNYTKRLVISIIDDYKKTVRRLTSLNTNYKKEQEERKELETLLYHIVELSSKYGLEVETCAERKDFSRFGIKHGKCIDDRLLRDEFGIDLSYIKDKTQRFDCGCMVSKDIGVNDTCLMGCEYCYATTSHQASIKNKKLHDANFPTIVKHGLNEELIIKINNFKDSLKNKVQQESLF